jgi:two-component system sensor histidine kinase/response regulator
MCANEIDIDGGLRRLGGNHQLYFNLLKEFAVKYLHAGTDIKRALDRGQLEQAQRLTHNLKGVTGNLSINSIYQAAKNLEADIKTKPIHRVIEQVNHLQKTLARTIITIEKLDSAEFGPSSEKCRPEAKQVDLSELQSHLRELNMLLCNRNFKAVHQMGKIKSLLPATADEEDISKLEQEIDRLNFESSKKILRHIAHSLNLSLDTGSDG